MTNLAAVLRNKTARIGSAAIVVLVVLLLRIVSTGPEIYGPFVLGDSLDEVVRKIQVKYGASLSPYYDTLDLNNPEGEALYFYESTLTRYRDAELEEPMVFAFHKNKLAAIGLSINDDCISYVFNDLLRRFGKPDKVIRILEWGIPDFQVIWEEKGLGAMVYFILGLNDHRAAVGDYQMVDFLAENFVSYYYEPDVSEITYKEFLEQYGYAQLLGVQP